MDDMAHPNVFFLPRDIEGGITLARLRECFPLEGSFHFRCKTSANGGRKIWRDLQRDDDVASIGEPKKLFLRVLRLRSEGDATPCVESPEETSAPSEANVFDEPVAPAEPEATPEPTRPRVDSNAMPDDFFTPVAKVAPSPSPGTSPMPNTENLSAEEKQMSEGKAKGNGHFKKGEFPLAIAEYSKVAEVWEAMGEKTKEADKIAAACLNNRAACRIQTRDFEDAIADATKVLEIEPGNPKAHLRRGTCYEHIEKYKLSVKDMEAVLAKDPGSKQAKDILNRVKKVMKTLGF